MITELFPFGRKSLRSEFDAALEHAKTLQSTPLIFASIRDILAPPSNIKKVQDTENRIAQFYDAILVHSDPEIVPLEASWPISERLRPYLHYTGFVAPPKTSAHSDKLGEGEILVSAGGGNVGQSLFTAASDAALNDPKMRVWRLLVGGVNAPERCRDLRRRATSARLIIEPARPDFRKMLFHASASISMCGYNTTLDLLQAGTPSVIVPFDDGKDVEQSLRANALMRVEGYETDFKDRMRGATLLGALEIVTAKPARSDVPFRLDGAEETVRIVSDHLGLE